MYLNLLTILPSKSDENSEEERLVYILSTHELFHQSMVVADCGNELFRDTSRGLEGGAFFAATLLQRKRAKTGKGKDSIDELKDFMLLKADVRFCQYLIETNGLNQNIDNTPSLVKKASKEDKARYLYAMTEKALRDLLPYFR